MAPSNPQSPHESVMQFIENLGEHIEEAMSAATSPATEKGDHNPPNYDESQSESGEKGPGEGPSRRHSRRGPPGDRKDKGPWGHDWRHGPHGNHGHHPPPHPHGPPPPFFGASWGPNGPNLQFGPGFPFGDGSEDRRGHGGCKRGGFGGFGGRGGMFFGGPWGWNNRRHHVGRRGGWGEDRNDQEFTPAVDVFDTPNAFVVHIALAGALKDDVGINYDFDNSELEVSGVVHRPGDEDFLKTIVESERRVGAFDRKIKLESNGKTIAVDADAITAKLENGLLEVTVPKLKKSDEPEKKKISIN